MTRALYRSSSADLIPPLCCAFVALLIDKRDACHLRSHGAAAPRLSTNKHIASKTLLQRRLVIMQVNLLDWYFELPIITRVYFTGAFATTALCSLDLVSPFYLYYSSAAIGRGELWRLVTNFFFFGNIGIDFLFHMYFVCVMLCGEGSLVPHLRARCGESARAPTLPAARPSCAESAIAARWRRAPSGTAPRTFSGACSLAWVHLWQWRLGARASCSSARA